MLGEEGIGGHRGGHMWSNGGCVGQIQESHGVIRLI
jgi:hypothetical protein